MDVNGTKFHSLLGKSDWTSYGTELSSGVLWDEHDSCVRLRSRLIQLEKDQLEKSLTPFDRMGAASDRYGNIYWLDDKTKVWVVSPKGGRSLAYWSLDNWNTAHACEESTEIFNTVPRKESTKPEGLQGLTITQHDYLVIGVVKPAGILIFDLQVGNPPHFLLWPQEIPFMPFDMTASPDGGLWILDKSDQPRLWRLGENFNVLDIGTACGAGIVPEPGIFKSETTPEINQEPLSFQAAIRSELSFPVDNLEPVSIEALSNDTLLILGSDNKNHAVIRHYQNTSLQEDYPLDQFFQYIAEDPDTGIQFDLKAHDFAFLPTPDSSSENLEGELFISTADRKQAFVFHLAVAVEGLNLALQDCYYPMRTTKGKGLVLASGKVFYDCQDKWYPLIGQRSFFWEKGNGVTRVFDGKKDDCVWHRLFVDAVIPDGASVEIECWAANEKQLMPENVSSDIISWKQQSQPYFRTIGSELPFHNPFNGCTLSTKAGTWETLFHHVQGRYLSIRLTLKGTGRNTPRIRSIRIYYPRFSYLHEYLPAVYRDDAVSADFLERFLANVEGVFTSIEDRIAWVQLLFDVDGVPEEFLDWLAGWFDIILQESWDDERRRLWLKHAMELFSQRGTVPGIIRAVRLATDTCADESIFTEDVAAYYHPYYSSQNTTFSGFHVRIIEDFLFRQASGNIFGDPAELERPEISFEENKWSPSHGVNALHERYQKYLQQRYNTIKALNETWQSSFQAFAAIEMPPLSPTKGTEADDWSYFVQFELGFTYAPVSCCTEDTVAFRDFLTRRYRIIKQLNISWALPAGKYKSFDEVPLFKEMPRHEKQLYDWIQFVSTVLPTKHSAHQFTVLVPTAYAHTSHRGNTDPEVVKRIVELEKPAHTRFQVREYFAMFRLGDARLGVETILEPGRPLQDVVLGDSHLAEGFLPVPPGWKAPGRFMLGSDPSEIVKKNKGELGVKILRREK